MPFTQGKVTMLHRKRIEAELKSSGRQNSKALILSRDKKFDSMQNAQVQEVVKALRSAIAERNPQAAYDIISKVSEPACLPVIMHLLKNSANEFRGCWLALLENSALKAELNQYELTIFLNDVVELSKIILRFQKESIKIFEHIVWEPHYCHSLGYANILQACQEDSELLASIDTQRRFLPHLESAHQLYLSNENDETGHLQNSLPLNLASNRKFNSSQNETVLQVEKDLSAAIVSQNFFDTDKIIAKVSDPACIPVIINLIKNNGIEARYCWRELLKNKILEAEFSQSELSIILNDVLKLRKMTAMLPERLNQTFNRIISDPLLCRRLGYTNILQACKKDSKFLTLLLTQGDFLFHLEISHLVEALNDHVEIAQATVEHLAATFQSAPSAEILAWKDRNLPILLGECGAFCDTALNNERIYPYIAECILTLETSQIEDILRHNLPLARQVILALLLKLTTAPDDPQVMDWLATKLPALFINCHTLRMAAVEKQQLHPFLRTHESYFATEFRENVDFAFELLKEPGSLDFLQITYEMISQHELLNAQQLWDTIHYFLQLNDEANVKRYTSCLIKIWEVEKLEMINANEASMEQLEEKFLALREYFSLPANLQEKTGDRELFSCLLHLLFILSHTFRKKILAQEVLVSVLKRDFLLQFYEEDFDFNAAVSQEPDVLAFLNLRPPISFNARELMLMAKQYQAQGNLARYEDYQLKAYAKWSKEEEVEPTLCTLLRQQASLEDIVAGSTEPVPAFTPLKATQLPSPSEKMGETQTTKSQRLKVQS